jgi:hypothetical protein
VHVVVKLDRLRLWSYGSLDRIPPGSRVVAYLEKNKTDGI